LQQKQLSGRELRHDADGLALRDELHFGGVHPVVRVTV
jgi:hypothetical protein